MTTLIDLTRSSGSAGSDSARTGPAPARRRSASSPAVPLSPTFHPPFIPNAETKSEWDSHLRGVVEYYAPEGYVEDACAFRVAALLWRLNRLARAELDDVARSIAESERDAAATVASRAAEPAHVRPILPSDVAGLTRCARDASLAADLLAEFHNWPNHDEIPDDRARAAHFYLSAFYSHSPNNPPPDAPPVGWDGTRLRSALMKLAVNRSLYDDLAAATQFARDVATAAERRLAGIRALTARLRRERLVPQSPLSSQVRESEAALALQLHQAIEQLHLLQTRRPLGSG